MISLSLIERSVEQRVAAGERRGATGVAAALGRREEEAEDDAEERRESAADERRLQVDRVGDPAECDSGDAAEPHREPDREPGRHADVPRQVHLAQHHRDAERADDADADHHQRDRADKASDEHEDEDHRRQDRLGDEQRPPEPEPVRDRAEQQRPDGAGEQHQREQAIAVGLRVAERHDPERDEREQAEPRDAAQPDHAAEDDHRPRRRPSPRPSELPLLARAPAREVRQHAEHGERPSDDRDRSQQTAGPETEPEHERRDDDRAERIARVAADVEERHPARPLAAAREDGELRSLRVERGDADAREEDEHEEQAVARRDRGEAEADSRQRDPGGSSQSAPRRSDQSPKSGCMSDEETSTASISAAVSV